VKQVDRITSLEKRIEVIEALLICYGVLPEQVNVVRAQVSFMADALSDVVATSPLPDFASRSPGRPERPRSAHERAAALGWEQGGAQ